MARPLKRLTNRLSVRMLVLAALMTVLTLTIGIGSSFLITHFDIYDLTAQMPRQRWLELEQMLRPEPEIHERFRWMYARYSQTEIRPQDWYFIAGVAVVSTVLGGCIAFIFARRLSRPITAVADAAAEIAEGNSDVRVVSEGTTGELAELVESFNLMAADIDAHKRERSILTAGIAHELRTPLTVLRGRLHGLIDGVIPIDEQEAAQLLRHVDKLSRVVEDLRTLAYAEVKALHLEMRPMSALEAAQLVAADLEPLATAAGVRIEVSGTDAPIKADPIRLEQALGNIIVNAVRHSPANATVALHVRTVGGMVDFAVDDSGPGFLAGDRERLFAPFWRANSKANAKRPGSGIGLSLALKIAQAHGGTILASNRPDGGGATFTLRLPLA